MRGKKNISDISKFNKAAQIANKTYAEAQKEETLRMLRDRKQKFG